MKVFRRKSKINKIVPYVEIKECDYNDIIHSEKYFKRKEPYRDWETDRKSTRLNSSHSAKSRMPSSA